MTAPDHVLVTGFPRLLAKLLVREILKEPGARVSLLVRPRWMAEARALVASLPAPADLAESVPLDTASEMASRVNLIEGDVTSIDLGLGGAEFLALARSVTAIHHAAQVVYEGTDAKRTAAVNVQGTREVLEFARAAVADGGLRRLVAYTSTLVAGDHAGVFSEDNLDVGQRFRSHVEETLYHAELLLQASAEAVPITVLRPSIVVGDSRTGEIDVFDGPYLFVLLLLGSPMDVTLPLPARGDTPLNLVPVDFVARAGVVLGRDPLATSKTLHLVDPAPLAARTVFERIARAAGRRLPWGFIPVNITRALLRTPGLERFARSPRAFLERVATRTVVTSERARDLLRPTGITCPPFEDYVDPLVGYVRQHLATRRARVRNAPAVEETIEDPLA